MKDHTSCAAAAARANQEDPIVMYFVVRESLSMTAGKACAQVGHAAQMLLLQYFNDGSAITNKHDVFRQWLDGSFRKVVLKADDKEWEKLKAEFAVGDIVLVVDAGLTQVASGSETCVGIWPMLKSSRPKILKRLQALE
jgi:peptidyl-tRNA hydrolase